MGRREIEINAIVQRAYLGEITAAAANVELDRLQVRGGWAQGGSEFVGYDYLEQKWLDIRMEG